MIGMRSPLLAAALLCGALLAGCGSSSSSSSSSSTTASTPASTATSTPAATGTTSTSPTTTTGATAPTGNVAEYVAICKSIIERVPTLSASVKSKVEGICTKAAHGDAAGARAAAKEVCVEVIDASPISGAEKERALAACKAA